jgi:hypothetical protein
MSDNEVLRVLLHGRPAYQVWLCTSQAQTLQPCDRLSLTWELSDIVLEHCLRMTHAVSTTFWLASWHNTTFSRVLGQMITQPYFSSNLRAYRGVNMYVRGVTVNRKRLTHHTRTVDTVDS